MILLINTITCPRTIKIKPIDVKTSSYEYNVDSNDQDTKLKIVHHVRISKHKT